MSFTSELVVKRDITHDDVWILQEPLVWECEKYRIMVLDGFDFDFASIPTIVAMLLPNNGQEYDKASCLHDGLYASRALPKNECDKLFYEAMLIDKVPRYKAWVMYQAVKWFGHKVYNDGDTQEYKKLVVVEFKRL